MRRGRRERRARAVGGLLRGGLASPSVPERAEAPSGGSGRDAGPGAGRPGATARGADSQSAQEHRRWIVADGQEGRLDRHVAVELETSRSRAASLVEEGRVQVDGRPARKSQHVCAGQRVDARVRPPPPVAAEPEDIPIAVVFEDADLVVVDKPAGLVVHPAPGHPSGTLVNALLHQVGELSGVGGAWRPGIVHRLDRDTSGLMVVAKSERAHRELSRALQERSVGRRYLTALWGRLPDSAATVDRPVGRHPRDRVRMAVVAGGRPAQTRFRVLERWRAACLCEAKLGTGRTHQIRVHAASVGHPVVGDAVYGAARERGFQGPDGQWARALAQRTPRQFLHACRLEFAHPASGAPMAFESPLPPCLERVRLWAARL